MIMTVDTYNSALIGSTCHALTQTLWGKCRDGNGSARNGVGTWDVNIVTRESADGDNGSGDEGAGVSWMGDMLFVTEHHCKSLTHCWWHDSTEELSLDWLCGNPGSNFFFLKTNFYSNYRSKTNASCLHVYKPWSAYEAPSEPLCLDCPHNVVS